MPRIISGIFLSIVSCACFSGSLFSQIPKTKEKLTEPLSEPATNYQEGVMGKIFGCITIPLSKGPLVLLPVLDSSRDLGPNFGIMPLWAIKDKQKNTVTSVMAPSVNYNKYLKTTITHRHYVFPDNKSIFVFRGAYSQEVEREFIFYYYTPQLFRKNLRISAETKRWVTGKPSFYGFGIDSIEDDKTNYALHMTGEEFTVDLPLFGNFFFDFTHSYYAKKISRGPLEENQTNKFAQEFAAASAGKDFVTHRLALLYDDTDHPFLPTTGTNASFSIGFSNRFFGSDYDYRTYSAELKHYYNYGNRGKFVTAARCLVQWQEGGDLPFYGRIQLGESTGLRMAGDGRFTDRGKFVFNIEERIRVSRASFLKFLVSEFELAPFLDVGTVFPKLSEFKASDLKFGPGVAFRIVLRPQVVGTADIAFGSEGANAIIKIGYPF
ncbi:MAG: BamA/TamA family outer membrane protein [Elusimicrobia bacterium]|nr:BamA/TamA family outer membrane protein [Elusimicrobiota bacterium]